MSSLFTIQTESLNLDNSNAQNNSNSGLSNFGDNNSSNKQYSLNKQNYSNSGEQNTLYLLDQQYNMNSNQQNIPPNRNKNTNANSNNSEPRNNITPLSITNVNLDIISNIDYDVNSPFMELEFRVDETKKVFNYRDEKYVIVCIKNNKKKVFKNEIKASIYFNGTLKLDQVLEKDFEIPSGEVKEWKIVLTKKNLFYKNGEINVRLHFFNKDNKEECKSIKSSITITRP